MLSISKKFYVILFACAALLTAPAAAELQFNDGGEVWVTGSQTEVNFTSMNGSVEEVWLNVSNGNNISFNEEVFDKEYLTGNDFNQVLSELDERDLGSYDYFLNVKMKEGGEPIAKDVNLNHLRVPEVSETYEGEYSGQYGMGYFGEIVGWEGRNEFTKPVTGFDIELYGATQEFDSERLEFTDSPDNVLTNSISYSSSSDSLEMETTEGYVPPTSDNSDRNIRNLDIEYEYGSGPGALIESFKVPVRVYPWRPEIIRGDPGRKIRYENLGTLQYELNIDSAPSYTEDLSEEDFVVSVQDLEGNKVYEEKDWVSTGESSDAEYLLSLNNVPDLETGKYRFLFEIRKEDIGAVPVDSVRVVKTRQFSGQVRDSTGSGVKTRMTLRNNERTIPVDAGSDGLYSKEISAEGDKYSTVNLKFFDRGQSASDATFNLDGVDLGEESSVGGSEAVKFEYWENAPVDVSGINPVNMMAVKFGYNIGSAKTSMAFNPANINPEDLKVFECSSWNFLGRKCLGDWEQVSGNDVSINYANWRVNIGNLDLHQISEDVGEEKDILMNSYLVGTNAQLGLEGEESPLSLSSGSIVSGGDLEVSGTVISSQGNPVEGANVTVELLNDSEVVDIYSVESGSDGSFTVSGTVPSRPGDYRLGVELRKDPYKSFETVSDSGIEVFYETGMEIESSERVDIVPGEESQVSFDLRNTGQVPVEEVEVSLEGLEQRFYELDAVPTSLGEGEVQEIVYDVNLPEGFCPYPCGDPPSFNIQVSGMAEGEEQRASTSVFTNLVGQREEDSRVEDTENETEDVNESSDNSTSLTGSVQEEVIAPTGAFLQSQSSLNIALGLIMIFSMILAAAIKKNDGDDGRDRRSGYRQPYSNSRGQKHEPDTGSPAPVENKEEESDSSQRDTDVKEESDEETGAEGSNEESEDAESEDEPDGDTQDEDGKYVCEETGETFDTKEALEMHRKINGLE